jgi:ketosteroid isomerase-like protein
VADKSLTKLIPIYFKAYETKDRSALESTLSDDFTFTSPHDDHIDRATYLERC